MDNIDRYALEARLAEIEEVTEIPQNLQPYLLKVA